MEYVDIVKKFKVSIDGEDCVHIKRNENIFSKCLIVSLATHNNKGKFAAVKSLYNETEYDLLFLADKSNSYYLENDSGKRYKNIVSKFVHNYVSSNIIFFGSSMAGYSAIDFALFFNSNAIVNNPQVNLDTSLNSAWKELKDNICKIKYKVNLDSRTYVTPYRNSVIASLFGRHELDKVNMPHFFNIFIDNPGLGLIFGHCLENQHGYNFKNFDQFKLMIDKVLNHRLLMNSLNSSIIKHKSECES